MSGIKPIVMPKWGLSMEEGTLVDWAVGEGDFIKAGQEILDIETAKTNSALESPVEGVLRRRVAEVGQILPVGALLGVVGDTAVPDSEIDAFVADFLASFTISAREQAVAPKPVAVEIGGKRISFLRLGPDEGEPVVFLHGFGSDHTSWLFNQGTMSENRPTVAVDLPGHGASSKDVGDGRAETLAGSVSGLLDRLGLDRVHLVGHSLGAAIATLVAAEKPNRIASLTLISPTGIGPSISAAFLDGFLVETRGKKLRPVLEMLVASAGLVTAEMVEDVLKAKRIDGAQNALEKIRTANFPGSQQRVSIVPELARLTCPIQVIVGSEDRIIPPDQADALPESVVKMKIPGAGHLPHMEKWTEVNALLQRQCR